ncbi:hypothetical protein QBC40DRAFT_319967 [Triangularia verruculosa]|uniref:Uncharacterized protein n=1 Tax=Triangularia verruculosa TaxID=2587418 RepID=A0AAN6X7C0_9PEZI|nr:hypothetical protein QBC40DRAFT_319967 [Triangularia verruculosa]
MSDLVSKQGLASRGPSDPSKGQKNGEPSSDARDGVDTTPTIPQSQDYRIYPAAGTPELILSISDQSPPSFALDLRHSLSVYTENLLIQGPFRTSEGNIEIFTHSLDLAPSSSGEKYAVNCSGSDGDPVPAATLVEKPKDGNDGKPGGTLRFVVEDIGLDDALEGLDLAARGGSGSNGGETKNWESGGNGGNGADGGHVQVLVGNEYTVILAKLGDVYQGLSASSPSPRALYDLKTLSATIRRNPQYTSLDDIGPRLDKLDAAIQRGKPSEVKVPLQDLAVRFEREGDLLRSKIRPRINVSGGSGGIGGSGTKLQGRHGTRGRDGTSRVDFLTGDSEPVRNGEIILAHPDQCRMLLEKARSLYSLDDISSTVDCRTLLARLQRRLFFLRQLQHNDKLYQAYVTAEKRDKDTGENRLFIPPGPAPSKTNPTPEATSIVSLRQVLAEATGLVTQIDNGLDYYGNPGTYAPMLSYNSYEELTGSLLESAQLAEMAYDKFTAEDAVQEARKAALQDMQKQCNIAIKNADDTVTILQADLKKTEDTVASLTKPLKDAKDKLHNQIEKEKDTINKSFNLFKMPFSNIIDAVSMVIFCPKAPMAVAQTAGLLWKAGTNVPDDKGNLVNKTYLVNQINQIEATTDALDEGLKSRDDKPGVDIADPGASKLIAARDDMMNLLKQYTSFLGSNDLADMEKMFDNYINLVDQRNTAVLHYNACVNLWYTNQQHKAYYTDKRDSLSDTVIKTINPDLPAINIFVQKAYSDAVVAVMEALYHAQRSYRFTALTVASPLSASLQGGPPSAMRHADLVRASSGILKAYIDAMDAWGRGPQDFHGVAWPLDEAEWEAVRTAQGAFVTIPPATSGLSEAQHPFAGKSNVRVTAVRLFVTGGARTASGFLSAKLTHSGAETIVDAADRQFQFYHNPITREFRYRIAAGEFEPAVDGTVDGDISGGGVTTDPKDLYALVGPYTTWSIDLGSNGGLDLSDATGAYLKFYGKFYSFP